MPRARLHRTIRSCRWVRSTEENLCTAFKIVQAAIKGRCVSRYCTVLFPNAASILRSFLHVQRQAKLQSCLVLGSLTTWEEVMLSQGTHVFSMSTSVPVTSYQTDSPGPLLLWEAPHWCFSMFYPFCHEACLNQISSNYLKVQVNK